MISIGYIALANAHDSPAMGVVIQVKQGNHRMSRWGSPNNLKSCRSPHKVVSL
jgi:hypothetical protein